MRHTLTLGMLALLLFAAGAQAQSVTLDHAEYVGFWTIQRVGGATQWALLVKIDGGIMPVLIKNQNTAWYWHDNLTSGDLITVYGNLKSIRYIEIDGTIKRTWVVERGSVSNWIIKH